MGESSFVRVVVFMSGECLWMKECLPYMAGLCEICREVLPFPKSCEMWAGYRVPYPGAGVLNQ